jgi:hypothetical protein
MVIDGRERGRLLAMRHTTQLQVAAAVKRMAIEVTGFDLNRSGR